MKPRISAYVPVYNNRTTLGAALRAIQKQSHPVDQLFVVDDGSTDGSAALAQRMNVPVLRQPRNTGRGAARARAMLEAEHDIVLCCDATNVLEHQFVEKSLHWFEDERVAAVFGRISQEFSHTLADRWRARHLFKVGTELKLNRNSYLITYGTLTRKAAVLAVGNYDVHYIKNEDTDLGNRLRDAKFDVIFDPSLKLFSIAQNNIRQVLERYSRWYGPKPSEITWSGYIHQLAYALKIMAAQDLQDYDPLSVPISLLCPHVQYIRSLLEALHSKRHTHTGSL